MTTLAERAAAAAGRPDTTTAPVPEEYTLPEVTEQTPAVDPMADYEPGDDDPDMIPVHLAWLRVRKEVRAIAKGEQYSAPGTKFNFRGVDTVVNTFGPVTLKHGVNVFPVQVDATYRDTTTNKGNKMRECTVRVSWLIVGPKGDTLSLQTQGEALDSADKGTAKAQSVALRVLLLTGGLTPTHDKDPDSSHIERGESAARTPESYRDEQLDKGTSPSRLNQIRNELRDLGMLNSRVQNETGELETLDSIGGRMYRERTSGGA
ncbi:ERF family protein [Streptomyces sp. CB02613]|uniref:ERF family protein n=1 Tax=Streptomyces sp. CB02613 TaxID=2020328 RepID=UPI001F2883A6|nr:ERF family protein [Streptomyces sp. CB02613]